MRAPAVGEEISVSSLQGVELFANNAGESLAEQSSRSGSLRQAARNEVNISHGLIDVLQLLPGCS